MADYGDPSAWTKKYVISHVQDCLLLLQQTNLQIIQYIRQRKYAPAIAGLDRLLNGLVTMQNSKHCGDLGSTLSVVSSVEGSLLAFTDFSRYDPNYSEQGRRAATLKAFEDARDFTKNNEIKQTVEPMIAAIQSGLSFDQIKREYASDFPDGLVDLLKDVDRHFFTPELDRCAAGQSSAPPRKSSAAVTVLIVLGSVVLTLALILVGLLFFVRPVLLGNGSVTDLPGKVFPFWPKTEQTTGGDSSRSSDSDAKLVGNWYSVTLSYSYDFLDNFTEGHPGPLSLVFNYYSFRDDGTCDCAIRSYGQYSQAEGSSLTAFQNHWLLEYEELSHYTYTTDEEEGLSIRVEGAPASSFSDNSGYDLTYGYELRDEMLILHSANLETFYYKTDLDYNSVEQLIDDLTYQARKLSGSWSTANRDEHNSIWTDTFTFYENGYFERQPFGYDNTAYAPLPDESGWYVMPMGHPFTYGSYTFDGTNLVLTVLGCSVVDPLEWDPYLEVYPVGGDLSGSIELDTVHYISDNHFMDLEYLCDALDVDNSVH